MRKKVLDTSVEKLLTWSLLAFGLTKVVMLFNPSTIAYFISYNVAFVGLMFHCYYPNKRIMEYRHFISGIVFYCLIVTIFYLIYDTIVLINPPTFDWYINIAIYSAVVNAVVAHVVYGLLRTFRSETDEG